MLSTFFVLEYAGQLIKEGIRCGKVYKEEIMLKNVLGNLEYGFKCLCSFEVKSILSAEGDNFQRLF